jgi:hypothetical protein
MQQVEMVKNELRQHETMVCFCFYTVFVGRYMGRIPSFVRPLNRLPEATGPRDGG